MIIYENVDMKKYTSFKAGGKAKKMIIPQNEEELSLALRELAEKKEKHIMLGNGSNTLITDDGYDGTVIKLGDEFSKIEIDQTRIKVGSAALMSVVAKEALAVGLTGFEFASGIPGSIGGAVFMNAGAYGGEMKDIVESVKVVPKEGGEIKIFTADKLELSYRHSIFEETGDIVTEVVLKLQPGDCKEIAAKMSELTKKRNTKQPVAYPSAGSFFKRPEGNFAGKLIEDAGLKGLTVGGAQVSSLHSGFIINIGNATATDILELMKLVQNVVFDKFDVMLEPEVRIV
ncbi:MAG: UDP-N-acetylmuramate dehydrogenase [Anaerovoracaceae bacterium]